MRKDRVRGARLRFRWSSCVPGSVVLAEVVRGDVAVGHVRPEFENDGHRLVGCAPRFFAAQRERAGVVKAAREDRGDGLAEHLGAVKLEELARTRGHEADVAAHLDPSRVERVDAGDLSVGRRGLHRRGWTRSAPAISSSPG